MTWILAPPLLHSALAFLSALIGLMLSASFYKAAPRAQQQSPQPQQQQQQQQTTAPATPPKRKRSALHPTPAPARRPRPIPNSYWATPTLLACEYPWCPASPHTPPKLDALLRAGVRTFIDLTEPGELLPYTPALLARAALLNIPPSDIEYRRFAIRDRAVPADPALLRAVLAALRDSAARGRTAAVHCRGGIGRTGTVVGCWLVECGAARDGRAALAMIAREWKGVEKCARYPHSPETGAQVEFVAGFRALLPPLPAPRACATA